MRHIDLCALSSPIPLRLAAGAGIETTTTAGEVDRRRAVLAVPDRLPGPDSRPVQVMVDEVRKRTCIGWDVLIRWPSEVVPVIAVGPAHLLRSDAHPFRQHIPTQEAVIGKEGFRIQTVDGDLGAP